MTTTQEYIEALRCYKAEKSEQYGISRIGIFGSVARGEQDGDSDVDVCVELKKPSLFTLVHIRDELQALFGRQVDIVRLRQDMDSMLRRSILEDAVYA